MTVTVVRPNSQVYRAAYQGNGGETTNLHNKVNDDSDTTYVVATTGLPDGISRLNLGLGTISALTSTQRILRVKLRVKDADTSTQDGYTQASGTIKVPSQSPPTGTRDYFKRTTNSVLPQEGMWRSFAPDGSEWTKADIDQAEAEFYGYKASDGTANFLRIHEVYVDVDVRDQATVSGVTVTGATTTSRPTIDWTFTPNADGDPQTAWQVKVFSTAQYSVAGFDPTSSAATWDSGTIASAATTAQVGADLVNTTSYRAYVRAATDFNGQRWWSDWSASAPTTAAYEPVPAPTLTVTPDATAPRLRNLLTVDAALNLLSAQDASFEDATGGTGSWVPVNNAVLARVTSQFLKGAAAMSITAQATTSAPQGPSTLAAIGPGTGTGGALTSASFTPAANSLLVVVAYGDSAVSSTNSATISDSLSGSWTQIDLANYTDGSQPGYVQAWRQPIGGSPAAMTVTLTDGAGGTYYHGGWVEQWTNVNATPIGAVATNTSGGLGSAAQQTISITTANDHSRVAGGMVNYSSCSFTAGANEQITGQQSVSGTVAGCSMCDTAETSPAGSASLVVTRSGTIVQFHMVAWEIRGSGGAGTGDSVAATPGGTSGYVVFPNRSYTWLGSFKAATTGRSCRLECSFYDAGGVAVGSTTNGSNVSDVTGSWTQATVTATSPAGAAYARIAARVITPGAAEVHYLDAASMSTSSSTTWYLGGYTSGDFQVVEFADLTPSHTPVTNLARAQLASGGETLRTTTGFAVRSSRDLLTLEPTVAWQGEASLRWDVGNASGSLLDLGTALGAYDPDYALPGVPGTAYTTSAYVRAASGTHSLRLVAQSIDAAGATVGSATNGSTNATISTAWQRLTVTHTQQSGAVAIRVSLDNTAGDLATYFLDGLQHEEGSSATTWQPGEGLAPSWQYVRGARTALTTDPRSNSASIWDREVPPGVIRLYRASTGVAFSDGTTLASLVSAPTPTKLAAYVDGAILKDPLDPAAAFVVRIKSVDERQDEDATEAHPARAAPAGQLGQRPAVLSDFVGGHDGELTVWVSDEADWQLLQRMLAAQHALLLQLMGGGQRYIRIRSRSWPRERIWPTSPPVAWLREVTITFVEAARPAVTT